MEFIRTLTRDLCAAAVGCAILSALLPEGNLKKYGRALVGVFILLVLFQPFGRLMKENLSLPEIPDSAPREWADDARDAVLDRAKKQLEAELASALAAAEISATSVSAECHIDEDGVINIDRVRIATQEGDRARALLRERFGIGEELCDITGS